MRNYLQFVKNYFKKNKPYFILSLVYVSMLIGMFILLTLNKTPNPEQGKLLLG